MTLKKDIRTLKGKEIKDKYIGYSLVGVGGVFGSMRGYGETKYKNVALKELQKLKKEGKNVKIERITLKQSSYPEKYWKKDKDWVTGN